MEDCYRNAEEKGRIVMKKEVMGLIVKRDDGSEIVNYDNPSFPSYIYPGWVAPKVTWERVPHFHEDTEMVAVTEGTLAYSVNGKTLVLEAGDTIFINSNQIHYLICLNESVARYVIFVCHPSIISTSVDVEMNAVLPITQNNDLSYIRFRCMNEYSKKIFSIMMELPDIRHDSFQITKHMFEMWEIIMKQSSAIGMLEKDTEGADIHRQSFKSMMYYIQQNYQGNLTLDNIAASGNISKSLCNRLFNIYVGESPISYGMHFRVRKAAEYLRSTAYPLAQIADMTGFCGVSYMSETFRKFLGSSPSRYRKQWQDPEHASPSDR